MEYESLCQILHQLWRNIRENRAVTTGDNGTERWVRFCHSRSVGLKRIRYICTEENVWSKVGRRYLLKRKLLAGRSGRKLGEGRILMRLSPHARQ